MGIYKTLVIENEDLMEETAALRSDLIRTIESVATGPEWIQRADVIRQLSLLVPLDEQVES